MLRVFLFIILIDLILSKYSNPFLYDSFIISDDIFFCIEDDITISMVSTGNSIWLSVVVSGASSRSDVKLWLTGEPESRTLRPGDAKASRTVKPGTLKASRTLR